MPLFNRKFESTKPIPARSGRCNSGSPMVTEEIDDFRNVWLNLGNKDVRFVEGIWIHSTRKHDIGDFEQLSRQQRTLEAEKCLLQLKNEVLLDLLAERVKSNI